SYWVENLGNNSSDTRKQILDSLCQKGVLKKEEQKFLWLIEFDRYPTLNPIPELETRKILHDVILRGKEPDHRTLTLLGLVNVCNLINELFEKEHRKIAKESIEKLVAKDNMTGEIGIIINNILLSIG